MWYNEVLARFWTFEFIWCEMHGINLRPCCARCSWVLSMIWGKCDHHHLRWCIPHSITVPLDTFTSKSRPISWLGNFQHMHAAHKIGLHIHCIVVSMVQWDTAWIYPEFESIFISSYLFKTLRYTKYSSLKTMIIGWQMHLWLSQSITIKPLIERENIITN